MPKAFLLSAAANAADIPNWFAVCMGVGTVFLGLICIIIICKIMSAVCRERKTKTVTAPVVTAPAQPVENRQAIIAAVCAAAAEDMGTDISALRVVSFKRL